MGISCDFKVCPMFYLCHCSVVCNIKLLRPCYHSTRLYNWISLPEGSLQTWLHQWRVVKGNLSSYISLITYMYMTEKKQILCKLTSGFTHKGPVVSFTKGQQCGKCSHKMTFSWMPVLFSQYCVWWCPADSRSQSISRHVMALYVL